MQVVRKVLLTGHTVGLVMRIDIVLAVPETGRAGIPAPTKVRWDRASTSATHVGNGGIDPGIRRIALGSQRVVNNGLRQDDSRFGHPDLGHCVHRRDRRLQRGRVAHPDVLACRDDDAPSDEAWVLARLELTGEVVQCCVDIRAAHRLDERRRDVVVLVAGLVVAHGRLGHRLLGVGERDLDGGLVTAARGGVVERHSRRSFERGEGAARISAGDADEVLARLVRQRVCRVETTLVAHRRVQHLGDLLVVEGGEGDEHRARQQRRDDGEGGVLGRGRDEDDLTRLDPGQQGVLLSLGEAVDLIEEEDRLAAIEVAVACGSLHHGAHILDPCGHGRQLDELTVGRRRHEVGQRGLSRAGRAPDDRAQ